MGQKKARTRPRFLKTSQQSADEPALLRNFGD